MTTSEAVYDRISTRNSAASRRFNVPPRASHHGDASPELQRAFSPFQLTTKVTPKMASSAARYSPPPILAGLVGQRTKCHLPSLRPPPMNFKMALPSFNSSFQTLQNLIQLSVQVHYKSPSKRPRFLFISSISTVGNYPTVFSEQIVPEAQIEERQCALRLGYAQAKLVCERIIERAAVDHPEPEMGFVRVDQIAGCSKRVLEHQRASCCANQFIAEAGGVSRPPRDVIMASCGHSCHCTPGTPL